MSNLYAVILCGGRGERFWPRSRRRAPKQFVSLFGESSLTRQTSERISGLCPLSKQLFVTPREFASTVRQQLRVSAKNLLLEPAGRNTAPAIGAAAAVLHARDRDATLVVLPADHLITRKREFLACVRRAAVLAQDGYLVTFGIPPTRPDTGYGYVHIGATLRTGSGPQAYAVRGFREKPDAKTARRYLRGGHYLWNSGMFVWRADTVLAAFAEYLPAFSRSLESLADAAGTRRERTVLDRIYRGAPSISVDYAIMEKAKPIAAVKATFDWDDVGSWLALDRHLRSDRAGNVQRGLCVLEDATRCIVDSDQGIVAVLGTIDLVIVRAGDAVLVAHRDRLGGIRSLLKKLGGSRQTEEYL